MDEFLVDESANVIYSTRSSAMMVDKKSSPAKPETLTVVTEREKGKVCPWGDDNLFPKTIYDECKKSTIIPSTLDKLARMIYAGGVVAGTLQENGNEDVFMPVRGNDRKMFRDFWRRINGDAYLMKSSINFVWFRNVFPEIRMNIDRLDIADIDVQRSMECRYEWQNDKGVVERCYIDADWEAANPDGSSKTTKILPVINPYFDAVGQIKGNEKHTNYIFPLSYPGVGQKFYHLADWDSVRESGWLDVSLSIPKFKKSLMQNQMTIKYIIRVDEEWWRWKYKKWDTFSDGDKIAKKKAELDNFNNYLKGEENAGNTLMLSARWDVHTKQYYGGWEIEALDDKLKDGIYIEDSQEASSHLLYSLGMDPAIVGNGPGKKMGGGSGSDKRVAFNIQMSLMKPFQDLILKPLGLKRDISDEWSDELEFKLRTPLIHTLDSGEETTNKPESTETL